MRPAPQPPLTTLLRQWTDGDPEAINRVVPLLYQELRSIAARELRRERSEHTLQATALVSEAYLRLREVHGVAWQNRSQFLGFAAHLIRRILVEHARRKGSAKRGGGGLRVSLTEAQGIGLWRGPDLVALDLALEALGALDPRKASVVELRFFGGLSVEETAAVLELSPETVGREWRRAKAWLFQELAGGEVHRTV
ncbi:MAG TPA: sigma-70 family RNA polymerase sigma factor [Thermoanaerobaculia bacterium]|nr:sigma-70 family RNA polymerase sigma factor [Thermoanaerobaculia bacterium]